MPNKSKVKEAVHESKTVPVLGSKSDPLVNLSHMFELRTYFIFVGGLQLPSDICVLRAKRLPVHIRL